jgi:hypothetical protein
MKAGFLRRTAAVATTAAAVLMFTANQADAATGGDCVNHGSSGSGQIYLCTKATLTGSGHLELGYTLNIGANTTSATGCTIAVWGEMSRGASTVWQTPKRTISCEGILPAYNSEHSYPPGEPWLTYYSNEDFGGTTADAVKPRASVTFTWGSPSRTFTTFGPRVLRG